MRGGGTATALLHLARPGNCLMAAAGVLTGALLVAGVGALGIATSTDAPAPHGSLLLARLVLAMACAALLTAFGNALNDLRDAAVDAVAHPERPLPSGRLKPRQANLFAGWCAGLALACAYAAGAAVLAAFAAAVALTLVLYELRLKAMAGAGNVAVALLTALTFLFGAAFVRLQDGLATKPTGPGPAWQHPVLVLAGMAFLVNLARELAKDAQDASGDRGHRRTVPLVLGVPRTMLVATCFAYAAVVASLPAYAWLRWSAGVLHSRLALVGLGLLGLADVVVLFAGGVLVAQAKPATMQKALKLGMLPALAAFVLGAWR